PAGCAFAPRCSAASARCSQSAPPLVRDGTDLGTRHGIAALACWHPVAPPSPIDSPVDADAGRVPADTRADAP
ncbi:MAG: hypothetical protein AB9M60_14350, partial [Leptothrix sp. (in: b-proteobacteria)]